MIFEEVQVLETGVESSKGVGSETVEVTLAKGADDLVILSKAKSESLLLVKAELEHLGGVSGLVANFGKSSVYFGGVAEEKRREMAEILGFCHTRSRLLARPEIVGCIEDWVNTCIHGEVDGNVNLFRKDTQN
ncbi:hypothetical protein Dimus_017243 [Dionaea muscipula]